jgi:hypothetical protein
MRAAEELRGGAWAEWAERYGDWGRDGAMYAAGAQGGETVWGGTGTECGPTAVYDAAETTIVNCLD